MRDNASGGVAFADPYPLLIMVDRGLFCDHRPEVVPLPINRFQPVPTYGVSMVVPSVSVSRSTVGVGLDIPINRSQPAPAYGISMVAPSVSAVRSTVGVGSPDWWEFLSKDSF